MIIRLIGINWLSILDALIRFFGAFIALLIGIYAYKAFKATEKREYKLLALGFFLITFELLVYAIAIPALYIFYNFKPEITDLTRVLLLRISHLFNFFFILATLFAYTLFAYLYSKIQSKSVLILLGTLVFALASYSFSFVSGIGFNLTSILLLGFVCYHTIKNYREKRSKNSLYVVVAFSLILLSHAFFVLTDLPSTSNYLTSFLKIVFGQNIMLYTSSAIQQLYLLGHISQLFGYLSLFLVILRAQYGKKK